MGVMSCYRTGCDEIVCRTYIGSIGYICKECQNEFKTYVDIKGIKLLNEEVLLKHLGLFMNIKKQNHKIEKPNIIDIEEYFENNSR